MLESKEDMSIEPKNVDLILINKSVDGGLVGGLSDTLFNNMKVNIGDTLITNSLKPNEDNILYTINNLNTNITKGVHYKGHGKFKIMFTVHTEDRLYALKIFEKEISVRGTQFDIELYKSFKKEYGENIPTVYSYGTLEFNDTNNKKSSCSYFIEELCKTITDPAFETFRKDTNKKYISFVCKFCVSMFECLKKIYNHQKVHTDLHIYNIGYVTKGEQIIFKLIDYDSSTIYDLKERSYYDNLFGIIFDINYLRLNDGFAINYYLMPYNENQLNYSKKDIIDGVEVEQFININFIKNKDYINKAWVVYVYVIIIYLLNNHLEPHTISGLKNYLINPMALKKIKDDNKNYPPIILLSDNYYDIPSLDDLIIRFGIYGNYYKSKNDMESLLNYLFEPSSNKSNTKRPTKSNKTMYLFIYTIFLIKYIFPISCCYFLYKKIHRLFYYLSEKLPQTSKYHIFYSFIKKNMPLYNIMVYVLALVGTYVINTYIFPKTYDVLFGEHNMLCFNNYIYFFII
jgi:hypothetical protein